MCPQGKPLTTTGRVHKDRTLYYRASKLDCDACPLKSKCCPKAPSRRIPRDIDEDARDVARSLVGTPAFEQSRRDRKKVEMAFAHLKRNFGLGRLRLRGPRGAQDEFLLAATAQNLKKLARNIARPPPLAVACALRQSLQVNPAIERVASKAVALPRRIGHGQTQPSTSIPHAPYKSALHAVPTFATQSASSRHLAFVEIGGLKWAPSRRICSAANW